MDSPSHLPRLVSLAVATSALFAIGLPTCDAQSVDSATIILQGYVSSSGGSAAIAAIHSRVTHDAISFGRGISGTREIVQEAPEFVVERGTARGWFGWHGSFSRGYDGTIAWTEGPEDPYHSLDANAAARYVLEFRLDKLIRLDSLYPIRRWVGDRKLDGVEVRVIELESTAGTRETWFLSAKTGLLVKTIVSENPQTRGSRVVTTTYEDYREVDGVRLPFRKISDDGSRRTTATTQSVTQNVAVPHSTFERRVP
jgi:hypothetical protein